MAYPPEERPHRQHYCVHKAKAKARGIAWDLSFEQWIGVWRASGRLEQRGRGKGKYVMSRFGDAGSYSVSNVLIQTFEQNIRDAYINVPEKCSPARRRGTGRGWTFVAGSRHPYRVMANGKYVGSYGTEDEAVSAYRAAHGLT